MTEGGSDFGLTGLGRGGQQVQRYKPVGCVLINRAIEVYTKAVETLVELASLQVSIPIIYVLILADGLCDSR